MREEPDHTGIREDGKLSCRWQACLVATSRDCWHALLPIWAVFANLRQIVFLGFGRSPAGTPSGGANDACGAPREAGREWRLRHAGKVQVTHMQGSTLANLHHSDESSRVGNATV